MGVEHVCMAEWWLRGEVRSRQAGAGRKWRGCMTSVARNGPSYGSLAMALVPGPRLARKSQLGTSGLRSQALSHVAGRKKVEGRKKILRKKVGTFDEH